MRKLKDKQELFVREYMIDFNGTQAAIRAGYSKKNARFNAAQMLTYPNVAALVYKLKMEKFKYIEVDAKFVLDGLKRHALSDDAAISKSALDLLGKHLGLYEKDNTQKSESFTFKMNLSK